MTPDSCALRVATAGAAAILAAVPAAHGQSTVLRADRPIEFIVPAAPGGLNDTTMRNMQRILQLLKLVEPPITVTNKGGGGGALAWATLAQHPGDPAFLSISTVNLLTNHIVGVGAVNYTDFTPLGHLIHSYLGFAVKPDSPIATGKDLLERLRRDPGSLSVAIGTSLGNTSHIALSLAARSVGADPRRLKTVVFKSNGEAIAALFGGHVDVAVSGLPNLAKRFEARTLRIVAVTAPARLGGSLSEVPAWRELGASIVVSGWRGALGPAKLSAAQIAFWEEVVGRLVDSDEWQQELDRNFGTKTRMSAAENREFLAREYKSYQAVLGELGMAKAR
ncbi:MAG: tripartite tricarboxylate transporter substrate binding protein [Burkholderiales bacterium]|nr:tripartite tricarboxylate transporter substrate binding protein [Burkholderiales bacterium]